jgi:hypothetical protein
MSNFAAGTKATFEGIAIHERGVIIEGNQSLATLLNCSVESLRGLNLLDWFTRASRSVIEESILLGNFRPFEAVARRADKTELHVRTVHQAHLSRPGAKSWSPRSGTSRSANAPPSLEHRAAAAPAAISPAGFPGQTGRRHRRGY